MPDAELRRVVVTGLGSVSSLGLGKKALVSGIRQGRSGIGPIRQFDAGLAQLLQATGGLFDQTAHVSSPAGFE